MSDVHKLMARRLRADLAAYGVTLSHSEALELVAHQHGARDWNTLAASSSDSLGETTTAPEGPAVPILRIFDRAKAVEFYVDFLGFEIDWEHGYDDHSPLYAQVHRGDTVLHLSEHHGDASPGGAALIPVRDVRSLHAELSTRSYDYARPGVEAEEWGLVMVVIDPFHNRLVFHQPHGATGATDPRPGEAASPIELDYALDCTAEHAFDTFTADVDRWWDRAYAPPETVRVEIVPRVGGRVAHHRADGTAYGWGEVLVLDRPTHYAQSFTLAQDLDHPSRLDVWFEAGSGGTGCRMRFSHGGWTPGNVAGRARFSQWDVLLDRFAAAAEGRPLPPSEADRG